jgi:SAM-dependent methyltransferase
MDYQVLKQSIAHNANLDLAQRKQWYSPAAVAYSRARPRYPQALIEQVVAIAQLSAQSRILEVGCGPATATVDFAPLGAPILGLEPNPDFYQFACQECATFPNVTLQNQSFEEWQLEPEAFDVVLAASSFHWIPTDVAYPKAADALRSHGHLILLWNKELQPTLEVHQQVLSPVYQAHAPELERYEDQATQVKILDGLGQFARESGRFANLITGQMESEVTYSIDTYLMLLNSYSPYLKLDPVRKEALFAGLKQQVVDHCGGRLQLSYRSAFHIWQKCDQCDRPV